MATNVISAVPAHLKQPNGDSDADFAKKHHGKTRSHMVSDSLVLL
jgi:UTP--glucose-1-phosphate uridylyltransferase